MRIRQRKKSRTFSHYVTVMRMHESDPQLPGLTIARPDRQFRGLLRLKEHLSSLLEKNVPAGGEHNVSLTTFKQHYAKLFFELVNLRAEWRLTHAQPLGSPEEIQLFGYCDE